ncbi:hypothetical protein ETAA8_25560 [Anatilimnocola aggregata]|uniref:Uncharacterized protein n=1 Tax=Anatilimnocola aggregata TaxID=2528021 RepID=A0A517YB44_9BACT|nr:hypothetical protein [Anatilimnocola aggregata]QDU27468.1 hypothetical protein ETAA8_25560 [Anatilimnocola aggregata]
MSRIFLVLAAIAWLSLAANFFIGLWIGDFNSVAASYRAANEEYKQAKFDPQSPADKKAAAEKNLKAAADSLDVPRYRMTLHFYVGVASSLLVVLVNSVTVTYFVGTSKWCREVGETYSLQEELQARSTLIKRKTFPWAAGSMVAIVVLVFLGGLSDPSIPLNQAQPGRSADMVQWHYLMAMLTLAFIAVSFFVQALRIAENYRAIEAILAEVRKIRIEKGLPVSEEAAR